jgi:hypothetical protein
MLGAIGKLRMELYMSSAFTGEVIPLAPEEEDHQRDTQKKLSKQIKRATDQLAFDRNCLLIDSFIQEKWPENAGAT